MADAENIMSRSFKCPICKKPAGKAVNAFFPFCSERCKTIDLGAWLGEKYVVKGEELASPEELAENGGEEK